MVDVVIIGAGVIGASVARYLSRYDVKAVVVEKNLDVCEGTSKANSAIVHAGFDAENGSLMASYNVRGSEMMEALCKDLDVHYERNGSLVVCLSEEDRDKLNALYENGVKNGVKDLRIVEREELLMLEPNISDTAVCALYAPTGAIVCPFGLTIALSENAYMNGVDFKLGVEVTDLIKTEDGYLVKTSSGDIETKTVVNAAGVYSDVFHNMVCENKIEIIPRKGEYYLLDKETKGYARHTVFQLPGKFGKGVLVSPTVHGNTLVGPTAMDIEDKEGTNTTSEGLRDLTEKSNLAMKNVPLRKTITSFSGLRAHEKGHEFILGETVENFFDCAAIESPGLSSSPAIGLDISDEIAKKLGLSLKEDFISVRRGVLDPSKLSMEERNVLISVKPEYGQIICRCESISEGEILDAIHRPLGARTLDGIKRRTRAGMGRCQAGFCSPKVMEILARELHVSMAEIKKSGNDSKFIVGTVKDSL